MRPCRWAQEVILDRPGESIRIDGHEFPYAITRDAEVVVAGDGVVTVTIHLFADRVTVIDSEKPLEQYESPWAAEAVATA